MMQPRRANVGATVIAYCAEQAGLQVVEGQSSGKRLTSNSVL
jgi:hypothetical protein